MIRVKGTVFDVHREGGSVDVAVERGAVLVAHNGQETLVTTQQSWSNRSPKRLPLSRLLYPLPNLSLPKPPWLQHLKAAKTTQKESSFAASKAKEAESVNILMNIPNHVQALHDIATRRDAGALSTNYGDGDSLSKGP